MNIQRTRPYDSTCRTQAVRKERTGGPPSVQTSLRKAAQGDGKRGARTGPRISVLRVRWRQWNPLENGQLDRGVGEVA